MSSYDGDWSSWLDRNKLYYLIVQRQKRMCLLVCQWQEQFLLVDHHPPSVACVSNCPLQQYTDARAIRIIDLMHRCYFWIFKLFWYHQSDFLQCSCHLHPYKSKIWYFAKVLKHWHHQPDVLHLHSYAKLSCGRLWFTLFTSFYSEHLYNQL